MGKAGYLGFDFSSNFAIILFVYPCFSITYLTTSQNFGESPQKSGVSGICANKKKFLTECP